MKERDAALPAEEYFRERAARGDLHKALAILERAGIGNPPMNLLPLNDSDDSETARWVRSLPANGFTQGSLDGLVLGVRPEKISLADSGLPADVLGLEYLGADSLIACRVGNREWIVAGAVLLSSLLAGVAWLIRGKIQSR